jgi:hypothetical protein
MPTYFGSLTQSGNAATEASITEGNYTSLLAYTCPGSGNQVVSEISLWCDNAGNTQTGKVRLAIYDSGRTTLIAQGTAAVTVVSTTSWQGHLSAASITPNPAVLVGGTNYTIVYSVDFGGLTNYYNSNAPNAGSHYETNDYTGGFPASITLGSDSGAITSIRAGVDPQAVTNSPKPSLILQAVTRASYY